ncbi:hypothetical protein CLV56_1031 [Mumia flava]|uniref:DUF1365 family protein n=1 Tax=Mumia flava TaxID=1348852 RepID=A0A0B2BFS9_9ACTN|nr:DUF1365 domain-containing protein [Mumia flava]PJJ56818.1 hypothetical protein CLV56_1031 [Mumia flava]
MTVRGLELPAVVRGRVWHRRTVPQPYAFAHHHEQWLVDVDRLGRMPRGVRLLARFRNRDHFAGDPAVGLRAGVEHALAGQGIATAPDDRVLMLAHARRLGHVFDPLSVFWCLRADGTLRAVVLEVHNTYGGRHAYVVEPDDAGAAEVDKVLYVSPFNDTAGRYQVRVRLDATAVAVEIRLWRDGEEVLVAGVAGRPVPATTLTAVRTTVRRPFWTWQVSALIRWHGVRLWARGLPRYARTAAPFREERA